MAENKHPSFRLSFSARASSPSCSTLASYLLNLMTIKQTNLCLSADVNSTSELLKIAEELGDTICVLKTHADIISDFTERSATQLREIASRKHFLIFEDRKFADIGSTVQKQYISGPLSIAKWAEIVTVHLFSGPGILTALEGAASSAISQYNMTVHTEISGGFTEGQQMEFEPEPEPEPEPEIEPLHDEIRTKPDWLRQGRKPSIVSISTTISTRSEPMSPQTSGQMFQSNRNQKGYLKEALDRLGPIPYFRSALVLAQMSSKGNFFTKEYTENCVKSARNHQDFVLGFISQRSLNSEPDDNFLTFTPGVKLIEPDSNERGDSLDQQYRNPAQVIGNDGADVIIVGRGILQASDQLEAAERYRKAAWDAYEVRIMK
jgi:uridine monophosphate synthetase